VGKLVAILSDMSAGLAKLDWYERVARRGANALSGRQARRRKAS
jgi:hypothetical protein